jgi:hypothetical protein
LRDRIARYISVPLTPIELRGLTAQPSFREAEPLEWEIGCARIRAQPVTHRGPTLGYRIEDGATTVCYIPDHEPGLGAPLSELADEWISGFELARDASILIHDCQYADSEYTPPYIGWGHCPISDALAFGHRVRAQRLLLFHHDPRHDDQFLDTFRAVGAARWQALGGDPEQLELATELQELIVDARTPSPIST